MLVVVLRWTTVGSLRRRPARPSQPQSMESTGGAVPGSARPPDTKIELLWTLAQEPCKVVRREELTTQLWGGHLPADSNVIDAPLSNLRNKLRDVNGYRVVRTVRRYGFVRTNC